MVCLWTSTPQLPIQLPLPSKRTYGRGVSQNYVLVLSNITQVLSVACSLKKDQWSRYDTGPPGRFSTTITVSLLSSDLNPL